MEDIIKENPDDPIIHIATNEFMNKMNFLANVKKIFKEASTESLSTSIASSLIIHRKDKTDIRKFCMQNGIGFIDNSGMKDTLKAFDDFKNKQKSV